MGAACWHHDPMIRLLTCLSLFAAFHAAGAVACETAVGLEGGLAVPTCDPKQASNCVPAAKAVHAYMNALDMPGVLTLGAQTSPWRIYDAQNRIMTIEEVADLVRAERKEDARVHLTGSWTAELPGGDGETLAQRLSAALDGFPVEGTDGFLWLTAKGQMRTTRQAFSGWKSGAYQVNEGEDVVVAMVPGALAQFEDRFAADDLSDGVVLAGVGHDVFGLCPEGALAAFERAAAMGNAIGAYNAALMHEDRGDRAKAIASLNRAAALNDDKAKTRLAALREYGPAVIDE